MEGWRRGAVGEEVLPWGSTAGAAPPGALVAASEVQPRQILRKAIKVHFRLMDGNLCEGVLMEYDAYEDEVLDTVGTQKAELSGKTTTQKARKKRRIRTVCISTQVGCKHDCTFCANSKLGGLVRNLTVEEMVGQVLYFDLMDSTNNKDEDTSPDDYQAPKRTGNIDAVSFAGIGEPLDNPNIWPTLSFLRDAYHIIYNKPAPLQLSLSTAGVIDEEALERLYTEFPETCITLSLLSPFGEERGKLARSINELYPLEVVLGRLDEYFHRGLERQCQSSPSAPSSSSTTPKTTTTQSPAAASPSSSESSPSPPATNPPNPIFISYLLLKGQNDSDRHFKGLLDLLTRPASRREAFHVLMHQYHPPSLSTEDTRPATSLDAFDRVPSPGKNVPSSKKE
ncbi:hypothetical protein HK102_011074, partial [Quaeritorhiza haematococci]